MIFFKILSIRPVAIVMGLVVVVNTFGQTQAEQQSIDIIISSDEYKTRIKDFSGDANYLYNGYSEVAAKSIAYSLNAGWFNTAKPLGTFPKVSLLVVGSISNTPSDAKSFYVDNSKLNAIQLRGSVDGVGESRSVATIFGDPGLGTPIFEAKPKNFTEYPDQLPLIDKGYGINYLPSGYLKGQIGLFKGTDIMFKFLPAFDVKTEKVTVKGGWLYGFGLMHSLSQWVYNNDDGAGSKRKKLMPDVSLQAGYTVYNTSILSESPDYNTRGMNDQNVLIASSTPMSFSEFKEGLTPLETLWDFKALNVNLLASIKLSIITPYIGVGYSSVSTTQKVLGDFPVVLLDLQNGQIPNKFLLSKVTDPVSLSVTYANVMLTAGLRLKLAIFSLNFGYQYLNYSVYNVGIGIEM